MNGLKLNLLALLTALFCAALLIETTYAQVRTPAIGEPLDTLVLIEDNVRDLHVGADFEALYSNAQQSSGLLGAGMVVQYAQKAADETLRPLLELMQKGLVRDAIVQATEKTLAKHGMSVRTTLFQDKPKAAQFHRFPQFNTAQRWILIEFDDSHDLTGIPVALTSDLRQIRLSLRVSVYSAADGEIRKRLSMRNVLLFGESADTANSYLSLEYWAATNATALDAGLRTAMSELLELAISDEVFGGSAKKEDHVNLLTRRGPLRLQGRLIRHQNGDALIIDQSGNLILMPALRTF